MSFSEEAKPSLFDDDDDDDDPASKEAMESLTSTEPLEETNNHDWQSRGRRRVLWGLFL